MHCLVSTQLEKVRTDNSNNFLRIIVKGLQNRNQRSCRISRQTIFLFAISTFVSEIVVLTR